MPEDFIYGTGDVLRLFDDLLNDRGGAWWDEFFADQARPIPFFTERPDESLAEWCDRGLVAPGRVLELGCGNGRNAVYMSVLGCSVDAVDFSPRAIEWARQRAESADRFVTFQCCSILDATITAGSYDLVYDSGCFHHLAPHRRQDYVALVDRALKPGGHYGLVCFRPEGGSGYTDRQVYERRSLGGGLGYTEDRLRALWDKPPFSMQAIRQMIKKGPADRHFGEDFLCALLSAKQPALQK